MTENPIPPKRGDGGGDGDEARALEHGELTAPTATDSAPDSGQMRALLRHALRRESEPLPSSSILTGVQRKIRKRSRGKFYGDGWSTSQSRLSYTIVAITMLILLALTYLSMIPTVLSTP
jgi:hypothetical protein